MQSTECHQIGYTHSSISISLFSQTILNIYIHIYSFQILFSCWRRWRTSVASYKKFVRSNNLLFNSKSNMRASQSDRQVAWQAALVHVCGTQRHRVSETWAVLQMLMYLCRWAAANNCAQANSITKIQIKLANRIQCRRRGRCRWVAGSWLPFLASWPIGASNQKKKEMYAKIKLPELEKSQTSETHKSGESQKLQKPKKKKKGKWKSRKEKSKPKKLLPLFNGLLMRRFNWIYWPARWPFTSDSPPPPLAHNSWLKWKCKMWNLKNVQNA